MNVTFTVTAKSLGERPAAGSHRANPSADEFGAVFEGAADAAALPARGHAAVDEAEVAATPMPMGREGGRAISAEGVPDDGSDTEGPAQEPGSDDAATTGRSGDASPEQNGIGPLAQRGRQTANHGPAWKDRRRDHDQGDSPLPATVTPVASTAVVVTAPTPKTDAPPPPQTRLVVAPMARSQSGALDRTAKAGQPAPSNSPTVANEALAGPMSRDDRRMMPSGKGDPGDVSATTNTPPEARPQTTSGPSPRSSEANHRDRSQGPLDTAASGIGGDRPRDANASGWPVAPVRAAAAGSVPTRPAGAAPQTLADIGTSQPSDGNRMVAVGAARVERHLPPRTYSLTTSAAAKIPLTNAVGLAAATETGLPVSEGAQGDDEQGTSAPTNRIESGTASAQVPDGSPGPESQAVAPVASHAASDSRRRDRTTDGSGAPTVTSHAAERPAGAAVTPVATAAPDSPAPTAPSSVLATSVASSITGAIPVVRVPDADATPLPQPVQSITLSLDTHDYGQIDVRVTLKGNAVSVHLKAERSDTADELARDDTTLRGLLHKAGYETQQIQVDKRSSSPTGDGTTNGGQQTTTGSGTSFGQAAGDQRAATPEQRSPPRGSGDSFALPGQDTQDAPRQDRYRGTDRLYV